MAKAPPPLDLTVTSYDTVEALNEMYQPAIGRTFKDLAKNGANFHSEVDATQLDSQEICQKIDPEQKKFDRIVWNFPHAGFPEEAKDEHKGPGFEWGDDFSQRHTDLLQKFF